MRELCVFFVEIFNTDFSLVFILEWHINNFNIGHSNAKRRSRK